MIVGYAVLFGAVLGFVGLAFLGLVTGGMVLWSTLPKHPGWLDGSLWWVAVTAGAGLLVGVLRRVFGVPLKIPGTIKEIKDERVTPSLVPKAVAVSLVSLAGGASLGPEQARDAAGAGWEADASRRRELDPDTQAINTSAGCPERTVACCHLRSWRRLWCSELARIQGRSLREDAGRRPAFFLRPLFAIYFPIAGSTFVGLYSLPPFKFEDWQLAAAIPLGLVAGALALITVVTVGLLTKLTAPLAKWTILRPTIGGIAFGLVGVETPTLFTGTSQLTTVIDERVALGAGLLIAVVFAKMLVFALCEASGFIGGPFLVMLFIGGTAGTATHALIPGLPAGSGFHDVRRPTRGSLCVSSLFGCWPL